MVCLAESAVIQLVAIHTQEVIITLIIAVVITWLDLVPQTILAHQVTSVFLVLAIVHIHCVIVGVVSAIVDCGGIQGSMNAHDFEVALPILFLSHLFELTGSLFVDLLVTAIEWLECRVWLSLPLVLLKEVFFQVLHLVKFVWSLILIKGY